MSQYCEVKRLRNSLAKGGMKSEKIDALVAELEQIAPAST
jgi:hypothetical protein